MPISSIFQGNYQNVPGNTPSSEGGEVINSYEDTTQMRTNHDIPAFNFASGLKGFRALITVNVDADPNLSETFQVIGTNSGSDWSISQNSVSGTSFGSNVVFGITSAGQMQYTTVYSTDGFIKRTFAWSVLAL